MATFVRGSVVSVAVEQTEILVQFNPGHESDGPSHAADVFRFETFSQKVADCLPTFAAMAMVGGRQLEVSGNDSGEDPLNSATRIRIYAD